MPLDKYYKSIKKGYQSGTAREHSYRPALKELIESIVPNIHAQNEPAHIKCGALDGTIAKNNCGNIN